MTCFFNEFILRNYNGVDPNLLQELTSLSTEDILSSKKEKEVLLNFCLLTTYFFDVNNKHSFDIKHLGLHLQKIASTLLLDYLVFYQLKKNKNLVATTLYKDGAICEHPEAHVITSIGFKDWNDQKELKNFSVLKTNLDRLDFDIDRDTSTDKSIKLANNINLSPILQEHLGEHRDEVVIKKRIVGAYAWKKNDASLQFKLIFKTLLKQLISFSLQK